MQEMHAVLPSLGEGVSRTACAGGGVMARKANQHAGFRVDLKLTTTGTYIEYTSLKVPVTLEMTEALGRGLKRQGAAGRIVELPGARIVESWEAE
jgi:hypothetical protein